MSSSNPPAEGVRVQWRQLPEAVKAAIEQRVGGRGDVSDDAISGTRERLGWS